VDNSCVYDMRRRFLPLAIASMLTGNLLALAQTNVKRILAFSSIAHMGYLLVALLAGGTLGAPAATYYLIAYAATILSAFGLMTVLSGPRLEAASIDDYRGLFWKRPLVAGAFYYLRIIVAMYSQSEGPGLEEEPSRQPLSLPATLALTVLTGLILLLGIYPAPLWDVILAVTHDLG
jgi:NADH-quinone oxidoreductase subunit N